MGVFSPFCNRKTATRPASGSKVWQESGAPRCSGITSGWKAATWSQPNWLSSKTHSLSSSSDGRKPYSCTSMLWNTPVAPPQRIRNKRNITKQRTRTIIITTTPTTPTTATAAAAGAGSKNNYLRDQKEIIDTRIKNKLFTGSKTNYLAWGCQNAVIYISCKIDTFQYKRSTRRSLWQLQFENHNFSETSAVLLPVGLA